MVGVYVSIVGYIKEVKLYICFSTSKVFPDLCTNPLDILPYLKLIFRLKFAYDFSVFSTEMHIGFVTFDFRMVS